MFASSPKTLAVCLVLAAAQVPSKAESPLATKEFTVDRAREADGKINLFQGDPKRLQRANEVRREDFEVDAVVDPNPVSVAWKNEEGMPKIRAGLMVRNITKRPKTLAFPDAQRFELVIRDAGGAEVYRFSKNKVFQQVAGTSSAMPGDRMIFAREMPLDQWSNGAKPGSYTIEVELTGYPAFTGSTNLVVTIERIRTPRHVVEAKTKLTGIAQPSTFEFPAVAPPSRPKASRAHGGRTAPPDADPGMDDPGADEVPLPDDAAALPDEPSAAEDLPASEDDPAPSAQAGAQAPSLPE